jgi:hypothetical protein
MLTEQNIKEYQEIYFKEYIKNISKEEALRQGEKLVLLVKVVSGK